MILLLFVFYIGHLSVGLLVWFKNVIKWAFNYWALVSLLVLRYLSLYIPSFFKYNKQDILAQYNNEIYDNAYTLAYYFGDKFYLTILLMSLPLFYRQILKIRNSEILKSLFIFRGLCEVFRNIREWCFFNGCESLVFHNPSYIEYKAGVYATILIVFIVLIKGRKEISNILSN